MFDDNRVVFHVDVNSAYLSWEAVYRLEHRGGSVDLREQVCAVGGDAAMRHGIILAKSLPARRYGIRTGESIMEARKKCPGLLIVPPNYGLYEQCSASMMDILREYTPDVEQYSIDEAFMDMTGTKDLWGPPRAAAEALRQRILDELGFTVNVGVSSNKLLAKMASDFKKPNRVHTLFPEEIASKMWPLPVSDLFFVGRATAAKLHTLGIQTIGELARQDPAMLKYHLKKHGEVLWAFANGKDVSPVEPEPPANKGYGNSTTISFDVTDADTAKLVLLSLTEMVGTRLRSDGVCARVVSVTVKYDDLTSSGHQMTLMSGTNITSELYGEACRLFDQLWDGRPIRHLGVHTGKICPADGTRQLSFLDTADYERLALLDRTVDRVRDRYGRDALMRASFARRGRPAAGARGGPGDRAGAGTGAGAGAGIGAAARGGPGDRIGAGAGAGIGAVARRTAGTGAGDARLEHMAGGVSREKWTVDYSKVVVE